MIRRGDDDYGRRIHKCLSKIVKDEGVSQDLEIGSPNCSLTIYLHVNDILNRVSKIEIGCPKDTQTPLWLILWLGRRIWRID